MRTLVAIASAAAVFVVVALSSVATAAPLFSDNFDDGNADGWTVSGGSWSVSSGAYQQTGTSSDARARAGTATWANYTVSVRVRANAFNGANRFVALLARAQSNTSYYYVALRSNNTVELKKLVNGSATTLASTSVSVSIGTWYTLSLRVEGSTLTSQVNGASTLTASDGQYSTGQVGVATFNASATFDDINVESGTPTSPSPSVTSSPTSSPSPSTSPSTSPTGSPQPPSGSADGFATGTTGGVGGPTVVVRTTAELLAAIDTVGPLNIHVQGTINITSKQGVRPNKTILGLGNNATINGGGFDFYRSSNVIVRNLTFTNAEDDAINVGQESHHIWIDHNRFVAPIDGSIDIVRMATNVTVSWNHFDHTDKSMLIGHSDGASTDVGFFRVSIHHNFFDNSRQRHPRVRFGEPIHVYNNYFLGNELYAVASTMNGGVLVEGNYFQNVPFPCFSASGYAESGPGRLVQRNNIFTGSGVCEVSGSVAEPRQYYSYTLTPTASVPSVVMAGAGVGKL